MGERVSLGNQKEYITWGSSSSGDRKGRGGFGVREAAIIQRRVAFSSTPSTSPLGFRNREIANDGWGGGG